MQFPVKSLQGFGESPNWRGPVTTCTTSFCAASGGEVGRKTSPDPHVGVPTLPRVAGRRPISGANLQPACQFRGFYQFCSGFPAAEGGLGRRFAAMEDRKITPIGTPVLQASDVMKVACGAFEVRPPRKIAAVCCRIQSQRGLDLRWRCSIGSTATFARRRRRTSVKILRFGATRRNSSPLASDRGIMHVSVPGGALRDESLKRSPVEAAVGREVLVSSRLGSSLSWPTEYSCAQ